jgi:hypothetical protein
VEAHQVLVPVFVFDKERVDAPPSQGWDEPIPGLTARDFHVLEDGVEQRIQDVTLERDHSWDVVDNFTLHAVTLHAEYSYTPRGIWSCPDQSQSPIRSHPLYRYLLAYAPPASAEGSCHQIKVKVDRPHAVVYARSAYCNTEHSPSDPLNGTPFGKEMERDLASAEAGKISLSLQTGIFLTDTDSVRVHIALEFPWKSLKHEWRYQRLYATIGVMGMAYRKDGTVATRFSDQACCPSDDPHIIEGATSDQDFSAFDLVHIPNRYDTQIDLPPGEYDLRVVLSDGSKFGRVEVPLTVDQYDRTQLAVSSVVLCKRFHEVGAVSPKDTAQLLAQYMPQYVPLVSKSMEVTPAGDTRFKKGDPLIAYFEVYEPQLATSQPVTVQAHLRIVNASTGAITTDFQPVDAASYIQVGKPVIPIAREIAIDKLPKESYRLEVEVDTSDSAGKSTVWRTANFTVE